ncbi:hypothetical protein FRC06_002327, partial [Ceratobasidium sp. 370]
MSSALLLSSLNIRDESVGNQHATTRPLGSSELSYFLPSRGDGVNDMQVPFALCSPSLADPSTIWAIQRARHPLLAARLITGPDVGTVHFEYARPTSAEEAMKMARGEMDVRESSKD